MTLSREHDVVSHAIRRWDPFGLIRAGASDGKYELEIEQIQAGLRGCETAEDLADLISYVLSESISEIRPEQCAGVANEIWHTLNPTQ